jgi:hypothetical protein
LALAPDLNIWIISGRLVWPRDSLLTFIRCPQLPWSVQSPVQHRKQSLED